MSDITYEHIKAIAKLENDVKERDATIKQLKADIDHNVRRALELAEEKDQLQEENARLAAPAQESNRLMSENSRLEEENQRLRSSMKTLLQAWQRGDSYEFYEDLIEKHKLIDP